MAARRGHFEAAAALHLALTQWLAEHPPGAAPVETAAARTQAWIVVRDLLPDLAALLREPLLAHGVLLEHQPHGGGLHDLVALLVLGCAFDGPAPERWRQRADSRLQHALDSQILADGGHVSRSPMTHLLVLQDLLGALWASGRRELPVSVPLAQVVRRMQSVARTFVHPDGGIPLFNGSLLGVAPPPARLVGPATQPAPDYLPDTGFRRLPLAEGVLLTDGWHVELSLDAQRVVVDATLQRPPRRQERSFDAFPGHGWRVLQTAYGVGPGEAELQLRLHPSLQWRVSLGGWLICDADDQALLAVRPIGQPEVDVEPDDYVERPGVSQSIEVLRLRRAGQRPHVFGCWLLLPGREPTPG